MIVPVWEVYKRDSQEGLSFKYEHDARQQTIFSEVDMICLALVDMSEEEIAILDAGGCIRD